MELLEHLFSLWSSDKKAMLVEVVANDSCGAEAAQISQSSKEEIVAITDDETEDESCATECRNNPTEEEEIALTSIVLPESSYEKPWSPERFKTNCCWVTEEAQTQ